MSVKLNLPRLEEQLLKFSHLRYKVVPIPSADHPDEDLDRFFQDVNLPESQVFIARNDSFDRAIVFPNGGITAAFKIDPEDNTADIGISKCNLTDVYIKQEGRMRAEGRFEKGHKSTKNSRFETFFRLDMNDSIDPEVPISSSVRDAIIAEVSPDSFNEVKADMAHIRAYVAYKTDIPFFVELS